MVRPPAPRWLAPLALLVLAAPDAAAQYVPRFQATAPGGLTLTGNALGLSSDGGTTTPGTTGSIGAFVTTDPTLAAPGDWPAGTTSTWSLNGARAELRLPAGAVVLHAELVWGGHMTGLPADVDALVRVTPPGGDEVLVDPADGVAFDDAGSSFYARAVDVTALVAAHGAGPWTVGGVPANVSGCGSQCHLRSAGWSLIVAWSRPDVPVRDLGIWVGLEPGGGERVTLGGLCTPSAGTVRARVLVSAMEGDFQGYGDNMAFGPVDGVLTFLSGPNNTVGNFFASQINDDHGQLDTAGTFGHANLVPGSATASGRHGWDLTNVDATGVLAAGATAASAQGVTSNEQYRVSTIGIQIDAGQPRFDTPATQAAATPADTVRGGEVHLAWRFHNAGSEVAVGPAWAVTLPPDLALVPGSVRVDGAAEDALDPTAAPVALPDLPPGAQVDVDLRATVAASPSDDVLTPVGTLAYTYAACGVPGAGVAAPAAAEVRVAGLELTAGVSPPTPVSVGDVVGVALTLTNPGAGATAAAALQVELPAGLDYEPGTTRVDGAGVGDLPGGAFPFGGPRAIPGAGGAGVVAPGAVVSLTFDARVGATAALTTHTLTATAWADDGVDASAVEASAMVTVTVCGDGVVGGGEGCDDGAQNSDTAPGACRTDCAPARCGDGVVDPGEACDDAGLIDKPCDYGVEACERCDAACAVVPGEARWCGDGEVDVDAGEACDEGAANSDSEVDRCRSDCQPARCGDGVVDSGERCDEGELNGLVAGGCSASCDDRWCGDGQVDDGEVCDPGADPAGPCAYGDAACRRCEADCGGWRANAASWCGDGRVDLAAGEACDDGNDATELCRYGVQSCVVCGAGCQPAAGLPTWCGDGFVDAVNGEACDLGHANGTGAGAPPCTVSCQVGAASSSAGGCAGGGGRPLGALPVALMALALAIAACRPGAASGPRAARGAGSRWSRRRCRPGGTGAARWRRPR